MRNSDSATLKTITYQVSFKSIEKQKSYSIWSYMIHCQNWPDFCLITYDTLPVNRLIISQNKTGHYKNWHCFALRGHEYLIRNCFVTYESFNNCTFPYIDHKNFNGVSLYVTSQHVKMRVKGIMTLPRVPKIPVTDCRLYKLVIYDVLTTRWYKVIVRYNIHVSASTLMKHIILNKWKSVTVTMCLAIILRTQ